MANEPTDGPPQTDGTSTERYAQFLDDAVRWLHEEKAEISDLSRQETNRLARQELERRNHGEPIDPDARKVWAYLFVAYTLEAGVPRDDGDGRDDAGD